MIVDLLNWVYEYPSIVIEILGVATALAYLYFSVRQKIWLWPLGILTSLFYIYVFFEGRLYADMGLQIYYLVISFYGWYFWLLGGKNSTRNSLKVTKLGAKLSLSLIGIGVIIYWLLVFALKAIPPMLDIPASDLLYWDAFTTAASVIATWMLARKILEHWLVWIVVDTVSIGMYIFKGLYLTSGLFFVYTLIAVYGYFEWKRDTK